MITGNNKVREKKISFRAVIIIACLLVLLLANQILLTTLQQGKIMTTNLKREKQHLAEMVGNTIFREESAYPADEIDFLLKQAAASPEVAFCRLISVEGRIMYSSLEGEAGTLLSDSITLPETGQSSTIINQVFADRPVKVVLASPETGNGAVMLGFSQQGLHTNLRLIVLIQILSALVILCLVVLLGTITLNHLLHPLTALTAIVRQMAIGNLDCKASVKTNNEIGCLARALNSLSEALQQNTASRDQWETIRKKFLEIAHKAAMADISASIFHTIGNIATSITISMERVEEITKQIKVDNLVKINAMLAEHANDLTDFLINDSKGKVLPQYFLKLGESLTDDQAVIRREFQNLSEKVTMIRNVLDTQQEYAFNDLYSNDLYLIPVIDDALKIEKSLLYKSGVEVVKSLPDPESVIITARKSRVIDIFINLFRNACQSMDENQNDRVLSITVDKDDSRVYVTISDNGRGITRENLSKIFDFGFTTKKNGFGIGLYSCAAFMHDMNGEITAESEGPGQGVSFRLIFLRRS